MIYLFIRISHDYLWSFSKRYLLILGLNLEHVVDQKITMDVSSYQFTVLERKAKQANGDLVLHLNSSGHHFLDQLDPEPCQPSTSSRLPILINGTLLADTKKRYHCAYEGCDKAYSKPSRLEEHERSHTGDVSLLIHVSDILLTRLSNVAPF